MGESPSGPIPNPRYEPTYYDLNVDPKTYIRSYGEGVGTPSREWLVTQVNNGDSLLDVGCGPGICYENLVVVHKKDIKYRGIDNTLKMIEGCREMFPAGDFQFGDACELDEPDNSWDIVLLRHVLENTPGYKQPISEAYRVARKKVIIIMWKDLIGGPDDVVQLTRGCYASRYNKGEFLEFLADFDVPVDYREFPGSRRNYAWVIYKERSC